MSLRSLRLALATSGSLCVSAIACSPGSSADGSGGAIVPSGGAISSGGSVIATGGSIASGGTSNGGTLTGGTASTGGDTVQTGGTVGATGGATTGGDGPGTGGEGPSGGTTSGGSGSGGSLGTRFVCPPNSEVLAPTLGSATKLTDPPPNPPGIQGSTFFLEGPVYYSGKVYLSQFRDYAQPNEPSPGRIVAYDVAAKSYAEVVTNSGTNGLALAGPNLLYGGSQKVGGLVSIDLSASPATLMTLVADFGGTRLNSPNDLTIGIDGTVYFSDPNWNVADPPPQSKNRVYRYPATGDRKLIEVPIGAPSNHKPNGVALSPDGKTLYVGGDLALAGGDSTIVSLPVMEDGSVGSPTSFGHVNSATDGVTMDCAGNLYAVSGSEIKVIGPTGTALGTIPVISDTSNVAFGGPTSTTLYITTLRSGLYTLDVGIPGFPY